MQLIGICPLYTTMYVHYNENPRGNWKAGDCVIRAISVVTGKSWDEIYAALCAEGMYAGDWGNTNKVWDWYVRSLGFKRYICPNDCPYCYSLRDFAEEHKTGSYLVATGDHLVAVVSGSYYDAFDSGDVTPIFYYTKEMMP